MPKKKISLLAAMREAKAKFKLTGGRYRWRINQADRIKRQDDCLLYGYKAHREEVCARRALYALGILGYDIEPKDLPRTGRLRERIVEVMHRPAATGSLRPMRLTS